MLYFNDCIFIHIPKTGGTSLCYYVLESVFKEELNEETKKEIKQARADIKAGKFYTHEQVKKKLGL